ncbi:TIGR02680 family protein, partial [bacterium]
MHESLDLFQQMEPPPLPAVDLPVPARERFQPLRAGILNLWQYDDQELRFESGRLILRGENGTGKSKALELLLPFLLDADLSPQRLDPFGGSSRTMEWNLLQNGRYESRVGYVWLEMGRTEAADGETTNVYWTLGCGLRASQRARRVDAWYFLTRRRVGGDLALLFPNRTPLSKDQLRQQIGEDGWVFDTGRDYREKLDAQVFGLGEDRFATLRHLLLQLRR